MTNIEEAKAYYLVRRAARKAEKNARVLQKNAKQILWKNNPIMEVLFHVGNFCGIVGFVGLLVTFTSAVQFGGYSVGEHATLATPYSAFAMAFLVFMGVAFLCFWSYEVKRSNFYEVGSDD